MESKSAKKVVCKNICKRPKLVTVAGIQNCIKDVANSDTNKSKNKFFKNYSLKYPPLLKRRATATIQVVPATRVEAMKTKMRQNDELIDFEEFNKADVYNLDPMSGDTEGHPNFSKFPSIHKLQMDEWIKDKEMERQRTVYKSQNQNERESAACICHHGIDPGQFFSNLPSPTRISRLKGPRPQTIREKEKQLLLQQKKLTTPKRNKNLPTQNGI